MARETTHLWALIQQWLDQLPYPPSQARLAKRLELRSRNTVSEWKYGESKPTPENLDRLADEMAPVMGPDIWERLLHAVNLDQGYGRQRDRGTG